MSRLSLIIAGVFAATACAGRLAPDYSARLTTGHTPAFPSSATFAVTTPANGLGNDAATAEAVQIVRSGLESRGMKAVPADRAEIIVDLEYRVGPPQVVREWMTNDIFWGAEHGMEIYCGGATVYDKGLHLSARDASQQPASEARVWDVTVTVRDNATKPSRYVPMLARAAVQHLGVTAVDSSVALVNGGREVKPTKPEPPKSSVSCRRNGD